MSAPRDELRAEVSLVRGDLRLDVDLVLGPGVTALVGANGAGKTTLLRALAGLEPVRRLDLGGVALHGAAPHLRRLALVLADPLLRPRARVGREVRLAATAAEAARAVERLGLAPLVRRRCAQLSSGEAARVALARAVAAGPRALLLDEPLARLDAEARPAVRTALAAAAAAVPGPTLLVSHDPLDVAALASRVLVMEAGRLVQDCAPGELARRPRTPWVARFSGMELLRGHARGTAVDAEGGGALVCAEPHDGPVLVAVRASAVTVSAERPQGSARNAWPCTVRGTTTLGDRVRVDLDGSPPIAAEVTLEAASSLRLRPGTPVWASVKATDLEVYAG